MASITHTFAEAATLFSSSALSNDHQRLLNISGNAEGESPGIARPRE